MQPYAFLIEVGFEKIPVIVLKQELCASEELEEFLLPTWQYIIPRLTFNKVGEDIVIYKKLPNDTSSTIIEIKVKKYYSDIVNQTNSILVEIQSVVTDFEKNVLEKVYAHVIMNKNQLPDKINFIEKPLFNIKGEHYGKHRTIASS